jgi:hypothetical protein
VAFVLLVNLLQLLLLVSINTKVVILLGF